MKIYALDDYINKKLKNKEFKYYYERELIINSIARMVFELRTSCDLTQAELAKKSGTSQSSIARLESGADSRMPSIDLLARIVSASNAKLNISFDKNHKDKK